MIAHLGYRKPVRLAAAPSPKYPVGGAAALTDGLRGTTDYHCNWAGFEGAEMAAVVDLGRAVPVRSFAVRCLQDINAWIWLPHAVEFSISEDGRNFEPVGLVFPRADVRRAGVVIEDFRYEIKPRNARYIKARTQSFLACPPWHKGAGGKAWLFADEIVIE
jgi:hexosaminidase